MEEIRCKYDHNTKSLTCDTIEQQSRIGDYINRWNAQSSSNKPSIEGDSPFELRIVYHSCRDLYNGNNKYWFNQEYYEQAPLKIQHKIPTIHLTMFCVFERENERGKVEGIISNLVQRYKKVIDSSIWNYYVPIEINNFEFDYQHFNQALCEIAYHYNHKRYDLHVSLEYADLNARLVKQSFLIGNHQSVSPFLFHSENEMLESIKSDDNELTYIRNYRWRFLLLDDKSIEPLSSINLEGGQSCTKLQIVSDALCHNLGFDENKIWFRTFEYGIDGEAKYVKECKSYGWVIDGKFDSAKDAPSDISDVQITIDCVNSVDEVKACLQKYEYEIVLLDYLLNDEYGYQLLKDINGNQDGYNLGPNKRFFFMFLSAFTTAVKERLTMEGLSRDENIWLIGEGACPTNTPELFKYRILHLMKRRLEQTGISKLNVSSVLKIVEEVFLSQTDTNANWIESVRKRAYNCYHKVIGLHYDYSILRENDRGKSVLVDSFLENQVHLGAVLEHLLQMIHLIAFGTVRQWPEIWEEYQAFVRSIFVADENKRALHEITKNVERYIVLLKSK